MINMQFSCCQDVSLFAGIFSQVSTRAPAVGSVFKEDAGFEYTPGNFLTTKMWSSMKPLLNPNQTAEEKDPLTYEEIKKKHRTSESHLTTALSHIPVSSWETDKHRIEGIRRHSDGQRWESIKPA
eukprot:Gregarina_sp_Poly_1__11331@NODE_94_length_14661_cov_203_748664_g81_i0_p11_GENE_NODE_94_length_14661_cov_203_748664_g81_i0NODE_94_length_14661_cov_203_748664_g81_i0_p11_ORF_typecomplete_len125_score10_63_NODE_94_length_14661_cov_203_748664_g81_i01043810812